MKIIGGLGTAGGNNLARNDEINLFDGSDLLVDRLTYGDQTFPGTIRTQNASGQTCLETIGQDDVAGWVRSTVGDAQGSFAATSGDVGTPGSYGAATCNPCSAPGIGTQPVSQDTCSSGVVSLAVSATGSGPLAYQWQVEVAPPGSGIFANLADGPLVGVGTVNGSGTISLSLTGLVAGGSGTFRCVASNACGDATSSAATVSICDRPADTNCDGGVNLSDLSTLLTNFGTAGGASQQQGDVNGDGDVNLTDLSLMLATFGVTCP